MELLVEEEVKQQLQSLPEEAANRIHPIDVVAYTLNHLPVLYANSEEGYEHQFRRGKEEYGPQIVQAVKQALSAVQIQLPTPRTPLRDQQKSTTQQQSLKRLKTVLHDEKITWNTLPAAVERALSQALQPQAPDRQGVSDSKPATGERPPRKREVSWQEYKRYRKKQEDLASLKQNQLKHPPQIGQTQPSQPQERKDDLSWIETSLIDRTHPHPPQKDREKSPKAKSKNRTKTESKNQTTMRKTPKSNPQWENPYRDWHPR